MVAEPLAPEGRFVWLAAQNRQAETVRIERSGMLMLSTEIVQRLGAPRQVAIGVNPTAPEIAVRTWASDLGSQPYNLANYTSGARRLYAVTALHTIRRGFPDRTVVVPHRWDGDTLVIDCSGLPLAEGSDGR